MKHTQSHPALMAGIITLQKAVRSATAALRLLVFTAVLLTGSATARAQAATDVLTDTGVPGAVCGPAAEPLPAATRPARLRAGIRLETVETGNSAAFYIYFSAGKRNDTDSFFRFSHRHLTDSKLLVKSLMYINTFKAFRQAMRLQKATDKLNC